LSRKGLILLVSVLGLACGRTSHDAPADEGQAGTAPGAGRNAGGAGSSETGTAGIKRGGTGSSSGGTGSNSGGIGGGLGELSHVDLTGAPIFTRVQRLTNAQWENAVVDVLRLSPGQKLSADFAAPVAGATTFDNNEQVLFVAPRQFSDFESATEAAAAIATGSPQALAALYSGADAAGFVRAFGRRAFRRPLTTDEEVKYRSVFELGERLYGAGFANGAALVVRAMLQSPLFLYRTELGPAGDALNPYEIASKLSFWLLGTTPSDSLLDAVAAGKLASPDDAEAVAVQMLEDPRAVSVMRDFHGQLFHLAYLQGIGKPGVADYDPAINAELVLASNGFFDWIFAQNLGLRELLTSSRAYIGPRTAPLYGLGESPSGLELREMGAGRKGYFMQLPFLMLWSTNAVPNPIQRGFQLEASMLCMRRAPDPAVPTIPPLTEASPGQTNRQRVSQFTAACGASCHQVTDQLGFAFEAFDGLGRKRELDNGQAVDTTGSYPFAEGPAPFADGAELMTILAGSTQAHTCYSKHLTGYALGRDVVEGDRPLLGSLAKVSRSKSLKDLIVALVRDPTFRTRKGGMP